MILEARNSKIKVLATSRAGKGSVPGAQTATRLLCTRQPLVGKPY